MISYSCKTPAKLILSGEYSVLHGIPALSLALNLNTKVILSYSTNNLIHSTFLFKLNGIKQSPKITFSDWKQQAKEIEKRYQQFLKKSISIKQVLTSNLDLIITTLFHFSKYCSIKNGEWILDIQHKNWIGKGLGSSASIIVSILKSLFKAHNISISNTNLNLLAQKIENRQHGNSSGLDTATVIHGGILKYSINPTTYKPLVNNDFHACIIDTGKPTTTTGECVQHVQKNFPAGNEIWKTFSKTSQEMEQAWTQNNKTLLNKNITQNQNLLQRLGVVPKKVQKFIEELTCISESSAKICGSGAISGDNAGIVLFVNSTEPKDICNKWGYEYQKITISNEGVQC